MNILFHIFVKEKLITHKMLLVGIFHLFDTYKDFLNFIGYEFNLDKKIVKPVEESSHKYPIAV